MKPSLSRTRIPNAEHLRHPWAITAIAPDFRLLDAWALPVEGAREGFGEVLEMLASIDPSDGPPSLSHFLFWVRKRLGALLGWDDPGKQRTIPGSDESMLSERLPEHLRGSADAPIFRAAADRSGGFKPLYRTDLDVAAEIANDTVHGVLHLGWVEQPDGRYRAQLAIFVKTRGLLGSLYLKAIEPFRHLIVYPTMTRRIGRAWEAWHEN